MMETKDWESSSEELNDNEANTQYDEDGDDVGDDEEYCSTSGLISKFQFRKDLSKARWNEDMRMAEVVENKGRMWTTTGIIRNSKIYCSIEETLFLVEVGALIIVNNDNDTPVSLMNLYEKVAKGKYGCCWEAFEVYRHFKSLGYIVLRHGILWTMKNVQIESNGTVDRSPSQEETFVMDLFSGIQINEARLLFDVYLPNSKFRKSSPGNPSFVLCSTRGYPPSKADIEALERRSNGIPLKFCHIEHGRINYFNFNLVELPHLP